MMHDEELMLLLGTCSKALSLTQQNPGDVDNDCPCRKMIPYLIPQ